LLSYQISTVGTIQSVIFSPSCRPIVIFCVSAQETKGNGAE
jgi:hypothetical protein